jgi:hypothetical protein
VEIAASGHAIVPRSVDPSTGSVALCGPKARHVSSLSTRTGTVAAFDRVPRLLAPTPISPSVVELMSASHPWPTSTLELLPASPLATPPAAAATFDWIENQHLKIRSIGSEYKPRPDSCTSTRLSSSGWLNSSALLRELGRHRGSARSSCLDQAEPLPRIGMPPWPPTMPPPQPKPRCHVFDPVLPPPPEPNLVPLSPRSHTP